MLTDAGIEVTARSGTADELLVRVAEYPPDAVVVDIRLPPTHTEEGMRAAQTIRQQHPGLGVLVLPQYVEVGLAMQLLADSAVLLATFSPGRLCPAHLRRWSRVRTSTGSCCVIPG